MNEAVVTGTHDEVVHCPSCGGRDVRPSKASRLADYIMSAFSRSPFRCRVCRYRFYRYVGELKKEDHRAGEGEHRNGF